MGLNLMTHWLFYGARNRRSFSGARNRDTLRRQMIPADCQLCFCLRFYHIGFLMMHYTEICFSYCSMSRKNTFITPLHLSSLFTNKWAVLSSA